MYIVQLFSSKRMFKKIFYSFFIVNPVKPFDLMVEDGGHTMRQQQTSVAQLIRFLRPGGLFFLEDLLTSFIPKFVDVQPTTVKEMYVPCIHFMWGVYMNYCPN